MLPRQTLGRRRAVPTEVSPAPRGVLLDYDVAVASVGNDRRVSVGHVARTQFGGGVLTTTGQANWVDGQGEYRRGLTTWQRDNLNSGTTVQLGDVFTPANSLNGPVNLLGVRAGTDRHLAQNGGLAVPLIGGLADTRSTAEVYVDEQRRARGELEPGPYDLAPTVAIPGLNNLDIVQSDAFGRQQRISHQFYTHPDLLGRQDKEWGVSAGAVRSGNTDRYEGTALHASGRRGLTDTWTMGATVQAGDGPHGGGRNLTVHNTISLGGAGLLQADVSRSQTDTGESGSAFRVGYERKSPNWSVSASHQRKSEDYWEIADMRPRNFDVSQQSRATLAFHPSGSPWSGSVGYSDIRYGEDRRLRQVMAQATYRGDRATWLAGVSHDLTAGDTQAFVGVRWENDRRGSTAFTARSAPNVGPRLDASTTGVATYQGRDIRYQVAASAGSREEVYGSVLTELAGGELTVDVRKPLDGELMVNGRYRNSAWIGEGGVINGHGYSRPSGSFVLVEVPGQEGVGIRANHPTPVKTNKNGYALLANTGSLTSVNVLLDEESLAHDIQLEDTQKQVVAPRRGGAKAVFPAQTYSLRQFEVRLGDTYAPQNAIVESDSGEVFYLGDRGVLVLEQPATHATLRSGEQICELVLPGQGGVVSCQP
nr:fimbria/pilus outer membrane usher protein [Luteimonas sp. MC1750]